MNYWVKRVLFLILALGISLLCAYLIDRAVYKKSGRLETETEESVVFSNDEDAFGVSGCEIIDNQVIITGGDPQFAVRANGGNISAVHILFSEPLAQNTSLQMFYSKPGESFSEANSTYQKIASGSSELIIPLTKASYSHFRFDFEQDVSLKAICTKTEIRTYFVYRPDAVRLILFSAVILIPLCALVFRLIRKPGKEP